jgi:hypothetical protein
VVRVDQLRLIKASFKHAFAMVIRRNLAGKVSFAAAAWPCPRQGGQFFAPQSLLPLGFSV